MQQIPLPPVAEGEIHVGIIGNAVGDYYHLILLPGDNDDASWQDQMDWAKSIGGDLPDRVEQAMLFKHFPEQFKKDWYWSNESHHVDTGSAWYQSFDYGGQNNDHKGAALRARAVRRLVDEPAIFDLAAHLHRQRAFSLRTFGSGARAEGVIDHIRKELNEIEANPGDLMEWVDVMLLAFDGAWRAGFDPEEIAKAIAAKQTRNEARQWPDWRTVEPGKAIEHVRAADLPEDYERIR